MGKGVKAYESCKSCLKNAKVRNYCLSLAALCKVYVEVYVRN